MTLRVKMIGLDRTEMYNPNRSTVLYFLSRETTNCVVELSLTFKVTNGTYLMSRKVFIRGMIRIFKNKTASKNVSL